MFELSVFNIRVRKSGRVEALPVGNTKFGLFFYLCHIQFLKPFSHKVFVREEVWAAVGPETTQIKENLYEWPFFVNWFSIYWGTIFDLSKFWGGQGSANVSGN